jgi:hypothetical protein
MLSDNIKNRILEVETQREYNRLFNNLSTSTADKMTISLAIRYLQDNKPQFSGLSDLKAHSIINEMLEGMADMDDVL